MTQDDFNAKLGRIRDARRARAQRHAALVFRQAGKHGARALRHKGHISPATPKRGMGAGVRAAAGLIAPGSRRVIVKARYTRIVAGDLGAVDHFNTGHPHTHIVIRGRDDKGEDLVMAP